jgi:HK97 family phage portal protein
MGIISSLEVRTSGSVSDPKMWINEWFNSHGLSKSGASINSDSAMKISTVYACVTILAETIAGLPVMIYKKRKDGGKDLADGHYLYPKLHESPNKEQTAFETCEMMQGHLGLRGNAYAYKEMDERGQIVNLIPLHPAKMDPVKEHGVITYRYSFDYTDKQWGYVEFPPEYIWHVRGLSIDGLLGLNPVKCARESMGLSMGAEDYAAKFFLNDATPGSILEHPGQLKQTARDNLKKSLRDFASSKRHETMVLEEGMKWQRIGLTNVDSQFLESRNFQIADIARFYRMPLILLQAQDKAPTYASAEQFFLSFTTFTLRPWVVRWDQSANRSLLTEKERKLGYFIERKMEALLKGDVAGRYTAYASALTNKWMNRNEVRSLENLNPVEGGDDFENPNITPGTGEADPKKEGQEEKGKEGETVKDDE